MNDAGTEMPGGNGQSYLLAAIGAILILVAGIALFTTFHGDPSIILPYARNIARGDFFSYTAGTFSSGSTSPLWAMVMAIPYLLGSGVWGAKVLALLATLAAFFVVLTVAKRWSGSLAAAGLGALYVAEMMTIPGVLMFESPMVVAFVALSIGAAGRVVEKASSRDGELRSADLLILTLIWAALPVSRPDAAAIVGLQAISIWLFGTNRSLKSALLIVACGAIAALPALAYYGYSFMATGELSVSSKARSFALREAAQQIGPLFFSRPAMVYVASILYAIVVTAIGFDLYRRRTETAWFVWFGVGVLLVYPFLLVFVSPVTNDLPRYFLPVAPVIAIGAARALREAEGRFSGTWTITAIMIGLLFIVKPAGSVLGDVVDNVRRSAGFEEIMEREPAEILNRIAPRDATVLAYEVQMRYFLREDLDLLSLDGITDGRVVPYLKSGEIESFIRRFRPHYWVANDAVEYRPYLQRSFLHEVVDTFRRDTTLERMEAEGVAFTLVDRRRRPMPKGFAGWTMIFALDYPSR